MSNATKDSATPKSPEDLLRPNLPMERTIYVTQDEYGIPDIQALLQRPEGYALIDFGPPCPEYEPTARVSELFDADPVHAEAAFTDLFAQLPECPCDIRQSVMGALLNRRFDSDLRALITSLFEQEYVALSRERTRAQISLEDIFAEIASEPDSGTVVPALQSLLVDLQRLKSAAADWSWHAQGSLALRTRAAQARHWHSAARRALASARCGNQSPEAAAEVAMQSTESFVLRLEREQEQALESKRRAEAILERTEQSRVGLSGEHCSTCGGNIGIMRGKVSQSLIHDRNAYKEACEVYEEATEVLEASRKRLDEQRDGFSSTAKQRVKTLDALELEVDRAKSALKSALSDLRADRSKPRRVRARETLAAIRDEMGAILRHQNLESEIRALWRAHVRSRTATKRHLAMRGTTERLQTLLDSWMRTQEEWAIAKVNAFLPPSNQIRRCDDKPDGATAWGVTAFARQLALAFAYTPNAQTLVVKNADQVEGGLHYAAKVIGELCGLLADVWVITERNPGPIPDWAVVVHASASPRNEVLA